MEVTTVTFADRLRSRGIPVKGSDLSDVHTLIGESGGLSAIYEVTPSSEFPGYLDVLTEHGMLRLDKNDNYLIQE